MECSGDHTGEAPVVTRWVHKECPDVGPSLNVCTRAASIGGTRYRLL